MAVILLFECDGSIGPQSEPRDSRRSIGCGCGYFTSPSQRRCRPSPEYGMSRLMPSDSPISRPSACPYRRYIESEKIEKKNVPDCGVFHPLLSLK
ncbi:hypothetical protein AVEN_121166-1 [Araneus ventricosus]|uniref:Uncharacterized protein n=1 Tax=Araneus ventricosus TaxID=182803 RepID=A0A4Y2E146_ARAVE|nr:hypothetical protein AVEN_121166-1 [Araneus ventricosus]